METVTVLAATAAVDGYGDPTLDWTTPTRTDVLAIGVEPRPSAEPVQDARNSVTSGWTVYLPAGTVVTARNRLEVRGLVYDVLGDPADWRAAFSPWAPGLAVQCSRTVG